MKIWVALGFAALVVVVIALPYRGEIKSLIRPMPDYSQIHEEDVVMYMTSWCRYCKQAKSMLNERGIKYREFDIEKSGEGRAQYQALRGAGVPLIIIDGQIIRGFDSERIIRLLDEMQAQRSSKNGPGNPL